MVKVQIIKFLVWVVILSGNNLMNLIITKSFPPSVGGIQNLMWGLAKSISGLDMLKVFADYELNHEEYDYEVAFSIDRIGGVKFFRKFRKAECVVRVLQSRGHCIPFRLTFPPLQVAPSSACSVASLSQSPGH